MKQILVLILVFTSFELLAQATTRYVILPSEKGKKKLLKQTDLKVIDSLFYVAVNSFNGDLSEQIKNTWVIKSPYLYHRQYFPYFQNGQRMVWVNCFCGDINNFPYWRKNKSMSLMAVVVILVF